MQDVFNFSDVCNIIIPMISYYDIYEDIPTCEYRKKLGLARLNYSLDKKFKGKYIKALDTEIDTIFDNSIKNALIKDENNKTMFNYSQKEFYNILKEYIDIYGYDQVREVRKHIRGIAKKKELVLDEGKTLANYL